VLDGKPSTITENDIQRRNTIAVLLSDWGLITINNIEQSKDRAPLRQIKVISFRERNDWELCPKYNIGNTRKEF
jgi:hypothetical protein